MEPYWIFAITTLMVLVGGCTGYRFVRTGKYSEHLLALGLFTLFGMFLPDWASYSHYIDMSGYLLVIIVMAGAFFFGLLLALFTRAQYQKGFN
ncbi:hypothetical protein KKH15_02070 [Patescibacteria group bacterium]|nr:hypothetical protein [Patescibacteria group bacterium]MBU1755233.1 hypothetical protein [Patescibacteria group bacterium]